MRTSPTLVGITNLRSTHDDMTTDASIRSRKQQYRTEAEQIDQLDESKYGLKLHSRDAARNKVSLGCRAEKGAQFLPNVFYSEWLIQPIHDNLSHRHYTHSGLSCLGTFDSVLEYWISR